MTINLIQENKSDADQLVHVDMNISAETVLQIQFIKDYLDVQTRAEAVRVATNVCSLLFSELKRGNTIYIESKTGSRSRLNVERNDRNGPK